MPVFIPASALPEPEEILANLPQTRLHGNLWEKDLPWRSPSSNLTSSKWKNRGRSRKIAENLDVYLINGMGDDSLEWFSMPKQHHYFNELRRRFLRDRRQAL